MKIKGFTYGYDAKEGDFRTAEGIASQELLYQTGINWVCICNVAEQKNCFSTEISYDYERHPSDRDLMAAIERAHSHGVKVCLKPMVNSGDSIWRAYISFPDTGMFGDNVYWDAWFDSYGKYMRYYAKLAEETNTEMLCIGCEMCGTERKEEYWRKLIKEIRAIYHGKLVYNTNHGHEDDVVWFDDLDYIGTSAYFPVGTMEGASAEEMKVKWEAVKKEIKAVSDKFGKPVIFVEIGCRSARGCASMPWDFNHKELPMDENEQANFYDSCLATFGKEDWFAGMFWWDWSTYIYNDKETASKDVGFNIHLKKAEETMVEWYRNL